MLTLTMGSAGFLFHQFAIHGLESPRLDPLVVVVRYICRTVLITGILLFYVVSSTIISRVQSTGDLKKMRWSSVVQKSEKSIQLVNILRSQSQQYIFLEKREYIFSIPR